MTIPRLFNSTNVPTLPSEEKYIIVKSKNGILRNGKSRLDPLMSKKYTQKIPKAT